MDNNSYAVSMQDRHPVLPIAERGFVTTTALPRAIMGLVAAPCGGVLSQACKAPDRSWRRPIQSAANALAAKALAANACLWTSP
jgi:hypothetical protein